MNHDVNSVSIEMDDNDELHILSCMNSPGYPFIIMAIFNDNYYILLANSSNIHLVSIDRINSSEISYCIANKDGTVIIHKLNGIRYGYINYNSANLLTYDREAGCILSIVENEVIHPTILNNIQLSGMSYSLKTSNNSLSVAINGDVNSVDKINFLIIPINIRNASQPIQQQSSMNILPTTLDNYHQYIFDSFQAKNIRSLIDNRRLIILVIIIAIVSVYMVITLGLLRSRQSVQ